MNEYTVLSKHGNIELKSIKKSFSESFLRGAKQEWNIHPGRFDGDLFGVVGMIRKKGKTILSVCKITYSQYRYMKKQIDEHRRSNQTFLPLCVANLSYFVQDGKKVFIFGKKQQWCIDGGYVESIPGGFIDFESPPGANIFSRVLQDEVWEELGPFRIQDAREVGLVYCNLNHQYVILMVGEIVGFDANTMNISEHEEIFFVPEEDLDSILTKNPSTITHALLDVYFKRGLFLQNE